MHALSRLVPILTACTIIGCAVPPHPTPRTSAGMSAPQVASSSFLEAIGFYSRRERGFGYFIDRKRIDARDPARLADVLRMVPGVRLDPATGRVRMRRGSAGSRCPVQFYLDGVPAYRLHPDEVAVQDVAGVEVYRGPSEIPIAFLRGTASCGVIAIWTRRGR